MKTKILISILFILSSALTSGCAVLNPPPAEGPLGYGDLEVDYQRVWCQRHGGHMEVVFDDHTRADCVTATHAIEIDWASKWKECEYQALHYSEQEFKAGRPRRALCVLILKKDSDQKYVDALRRKIIAEQLPLDLETITRGDL